MNNKTQITKATIDDLPEIISIYNYYVLNTPINFDITPLEVKNRTDWFSQFFHSSYYQIYVSKNSAGKVLGYACSLPFSSKEAYETSAEISIYCHPEFRKKGMGSDLLNTLLLQLESTPLHRLYSGITVPNNASIRLHEKFNFKQVGYYHEVGYKFEKYWDVAWYEKRLIAS